MRAGNRPARYVLDVNPGFTTFWLHALFLQQGGDPALQGLEFSLEQAGLHVGQHLACGQQRLQFTRADPDAGQIEGLLVTAVVIKSARVRILFDRGAQEIPQFTHQAIECGLGAFEAFH